MGYGCCPCGNVRDPISRMASDKSPAPRVPRATNTMKYATRPRSNCTGGEAGAKKMTVIMAQPAVMRRKSTAGRLAFGKRRQTFQVANKAKVAFAASADQAAPRYPIRGTRMALQPKPAIRATKPASRLYLA